MAKAIDEEKMNEKWHQYTRYIEPASDGKTSHELIAITVPARAFSLQQFHSIYNAFHQSDKLYHIFVIQDKYGAQWAHFISERGPKVKEDIIKKSWTIHAKDFAKLSYEEAKDRIEVLPPQFDYSEEVTHGHFSMFDGIA